MANALPSNDHEDEHLETFSIVCLDLHINENRNSEQKLRAIINRFKKFEDVHQCQQFIEKTSTNDRLIVIVNGELGRQLVPNIDSINQIVSIYIYCLDKQANELWSSKYSKVKYILTDIDELIHQIKKDHGIEKTIVEPLAINIFSIDERSTSELNGKFLFAQVLIDCLLRLKSTDDDDDDQNELFQLLEHQYHGNSTEIENINFF